jgi:hypothetical protein
MGKVGIPTLVVLKGGPMDGYLVPEDAPVLQPDWPAPPDTPGSYQRAGKDGDENEIAAWLASSEEQGERAEATKAALEAILAALGPVTGDLVDLDLFTEREVVYHVRDVAGAEREFAIPADPPFQTALAFFQAHDAVERAMVETGRAKNDAARQSRANVYAKRWRECLEAFLALLRILRPETTHEDLDPGTGQTVLEQWMRIVIFRLNKARLEAFLETIGTFPKAPPPNRAARRASRGTSKS